MDKNVLICKSRPYSMHIMGQYECNYNCEFCGFDYRTKPLSGQLTLDNYKIILSNLKAVNLREIVFSGQGDPLLCREFEPIVSYTRQYYPHIKLSINTNGELLQGEKCAFVACNISPVVISLHSLKPSSYAQITGRDSLPQVLQNIKDLRRYNPRLQLGLYFAYSMRNIDEICDHVKFCHELGKCSFIGAYAKFYSHKRQFSDRNNNDCTQVLDRSISLYSHQEHSDSMVRQAMKLGKELGIKGQMFPPLFSNVSASRRNCSFPYTQVMVSVDGQIFPCGGSEVLMYDDITSGKLDFGNILKDNIDNIWNSKDYVALRASSHGTCTSRSILYCENCSTMSFLLDSGNVVESHFVENQHIR